MNRREVFFLFSLFLLFFIAGCSSKNQNTDILELFERYHTEENKHSDSKWDYTSDTLRVWYAKDDSTPDLKYKGQPNDAWQDWDDEMRSVSYYDTIWYNEELHAIEGYFNENNDFYVLLGASANKTFRTYTYNADNKITDIRYEKIDGENTLSNNHMAPVYQWALKNEPQEIAEIFPGTKLVPSRENAIRWKNLIIKYRSQLER